jgi:hypothetical protein
MGGQWLNQGRADCQFANSWQAHGNTGANQNYGVSGNAKPKPAGLCPGKES